MSEIGIILSSTRDDRVADTPAQWGQEAAAKREDLDVEVLDLRDQPLPFFDEVVSSPPSTTTASQRS